MSTTTTATTMTTHAYHPTPTNLPKIHTVFNTPRQQPPTRLTLRTADLPSSLRITPRPMKPMQRYSNPHPPRPRSKYVARPSSGEYVPFRSAPEDLAALIQTEIDDLERRLAAATPATTPLPPACESPASSVYSPVSDTPLSLKFTPAVESSPIKTTLGPLPHLNVKPVALFAEVRRVLTFQQELWRDLEEELRVEQISAFEDSPTMEYTDEFDEVVKMYEGGRVSTFTQPL